MYSEWSSDLINKVMESMTQAERNALDCWILLGNDKRKVPQNPGPTKLNKYGFQSLEHYKQSLTSALEAGKQYLRILGITSIADLPFPEPGKSYEGKLLSHLRA